jgi:DNA gyrase subunit A
MVQDFSLRYPLIDGQGNFGSIDGDSAAAYRYTEARLASVTLELLEDLEKETVEWAPNFDARLLEPTVLPGRLPNLLVNGSSGIAVGMSTNMPPHNLVEVTAAFRHLVAHPESTVEELMEHLPGPDFPTGGFIVGREGVRDMYTSGRGRIVMRARILKEALRGGREQLIVSELPYGVSKSRVVEQIVDLSRKGKLDDVTDVRDESDRDGMRLVIMLKRGAKVPSTLNILYRSTHLQSNFGAILLALDGGEPREFDLRMLLERYRDHRLEVVARRSRHDLERAEAELHLLEGLLLALDEIDLVIKIIRESKDREGAAARLREQFGLSEAQADAILKMRLAQLTALEGEELRERSAKLEQTIASLRALLSSEAKQLAVVLEELERVCERFGDARRTVILDHASNEAAPVEEAIADEDVVIAVSHQGFVKRIPVHLYRRRVKSGMALAGMENYEDDWLVRVFTARTKGWLLAFTAKGRAHFLSVLDVPESSRSSRGQSIYALTHASREDRIVSLVPVDELSEEGKVLLFVTQKGIVKRTVLDEFSNPRAGGVIAAGVREGDEILEVVLSDERAQVMLLTREGRAIRFEEREVSVMGRTAQGVKGIDLRGKDRVVGVILVRRDVEVLTMSEEGWAKRIPLSDFPIQRRGGMGTMAVPAGGALAGALELVGREGVTVVSSSGAVTQIEAGSVPEQGRRTRGSLVVGLPSGDHVVEVARSIGSEGGTTGSETNDRMSEPENGERDTGESEGAGVGSSADGQPDLFPAG